MTEQDPNDAMRQLGEAMHATAAEAERAPILARRSSRRWYLAAVVAAVLISLAISTAGLLLSVRDARAIAQEAEQRQALQQLVQPVLQNAASANKTLTDRGQPAVPIPDPTQHPTDALVAAATARVLANLPSPQPIAPSPGQIAAAVNSYEQTHPAVATPDQVGAAVGGYLAAHPPAAGPPPTVQQIQAAVAAYLAANPPPPGRDGAAGASGKDGANGANGKDGQTPPCMNTSSQCQGPKGDTGNTGPKGDQGQAGTKGDTGPQGAPPASWTWSDALGRRQTCTRSGGSDSAATYSCTASTLPGAAIPTR